MAKRVPQWLKFASLATAGVLLANLILARDFDGGFAVEVLVTFTVVAIGVALMSRE